MAASLYGRWANKFSSLFKFSVNGTFQQSVRSASKKSSGSSRNKRKNTPGKGRGILYQDGKWVEKGTMLVKQLGLRYYPGQNVGLGKRCTLFALQPGRVMVTAERLSPYPDSPLYKPVQDGKVVYKKFFHIIPKPQENVFKLVSQV